MFSIEIGSKKEHWINVESVEDLKLNVEISISNKWALSSGKDKSWGISQLQEVSFPCIEGINGKTTSKRKPKKRKFLLYFNKC